MRFINFNLALLSSLALMHGAMARPAAHGLCQTSCNDVGVACYAAAGLQFGTVVDAAGAHVAALACDAAMGTCTASCAALSIVPTL